MNWIIESKTRPRYTLTLPFAMHQHRDKGFQQKMPRPTDNRVHTTVFPLPRTMFCPPLKREREPTKFYFPQQCLYHKTRFDPEQPWCISLLSSSPRNNTTAPPKTYPTLRPSPPKNKPNSHRPLSLETTCKPGPEDICQGQMLYVHHSKVVT